MDDIEPTPLEELRAKRAAGLWPKTLEVVHKVRSDCLGGPALLCVRGVVYEAHSNRYGAVSARINGELLGLKPGEFRVLTWSDSRE